MNIENIEKLASVIENQPDVKYGEKEGFCMAGSQHPCGSPACIEGWSWEILDDGTDNALEISYSNASRLMSPDNANANYMVTDPENPKFITAKRAAKVLRNLAETGEVNWSI